MVFIPEIPRAEIDNPLKSLQGLIIRLRTFKSESPYSRMRFLGKMVLVFRIGAEQIDIISIFTKNHHNNKSLIQISRKKNPCSSREWQKIKSIFEKFP